MACHFAEYRGMFPIFSVKMQMEHKLFVQCPKVLLMKIHSKKSSANVEGKIFSNNCFHFLTCELHIRAQVKRGHQIFSIDICATSFSSYKFIHPIHAFSQLSASLNICSWTLIDFSSRIFVSVSSSQFENQLILSLKQWSEESLIKE